MSTVSRNAEVVTAPSAALHEYALVLRSVSVTMRATTMLYVAAGLLTPGKNVTQRTVNQTVATMIAALLDLPDTDPALVERVLRNLPDPQ